MIYHILIKAFLGLQCGLQHARFPVGYKRNRSLQSLPSKNLLPCQGDKFILEKRGFIQEGLKGQWAYKLLTLGQFFGGIALRYIHWPNNSVLIFLL